VFHDAGGIAVLASFCTSTGIRRAALLQDMVCALLRTQVSHDMRELDALDDEQIAMWLIAIKAEPGDDAWIYGETRLGPLTDK
jgi:hypothetical protein